MGNQQESVTDAELGWLCGILEGEGTISLTARKKSWKGWSGFGVDVNVTIVNTDAGIIEGCAKIFRKMGVEGHLCEHKYRPGTKLSVLNDMTVVRGKPILAISLSRMSTIKLILEKLYPHFRGDKQHRARLMLDFIVRRLHFIQNKGKVMLDDFDIQSVKSFYEHCGKEFKPKDYGLLNDYPLEGVRRSRRKRTGRVYTRQDIV